MSEHKKPIDFLSIGLDMAGIIFAVLLALWLEGWREDVERHERMEVMLERVRAEILDNRKDLTDSIEDNKESIEAIMEQLQAEELNLPGITNHLIYTAGSTSDSAWESAKMTESVSTMPLEVVTELASIYDTQSYYTDYTRFAFKEFADIAMALQFDEDKKMPLQKIAQLMAISNSLGEQLVEQYDEYLETMNSPTENETQQD